MHDSEPLSAEGSEQRLPPHSIEAEQAVLGCILLAPSILADIADTLEPSDFYRATHGFIYQTMLDMHNAGEAIDLLLLCNRLGNKDQLHLVGGRPYLTDLYLAVPTAVNATWYAKAIVEHSVARSTQQAGRQAAESIDAKADAAEVLAGLCIRTEELSARLIETPTPTMNDDLEELFKVIDARYKNEDAVQGVPTGFSEIDSYTNGFQPGQFVIIGARPSVGKTQTALNFAYQGATLKRRVAFFSLEQPRIEILQRLVSISQGIDGQALQSGRLDKDQWHRFSTAYGTLSELPLTIVDGVNTVRQIRARIKRMKDAGCLPSAVYIDHLMELKAIGRYDGRPDLAIREIVADVKKMAKEFGIPVILLHQLNRANDKTGNKKPTLSDLRESGAIEELADVIAFLWREDYQQYEATENSGTLEVIVAKNRNGPTGIVRLINEQSTGRLTEGEHLMNFRPTGSTSAAYNNPNG